MSEAREKCSREEHVAGKPENSDKRTVRWLETHKWNLITCEEILFCVLFH